MDPDSPHLINFLQRFGVRQLVEPETLKIDRKLFTVSVYSRRACAEASRFLRALMIGSIMRRLRGQWQINGAASPANLSAVPKSSWQLWLAACRILSQADCIIGG